VPGAGGAPTLVRLDAHTGVVLASAPITLGGSALEINDLAAQPGTGLLFGTSLSTTTFVNSIYTIDKVTGVATLVGSTGVTGATLAFGPDGTLYQTSSVFGAQGNFPGFPEHPEPGHRRGAHDQCALHAGARGGPWFCFLTLLYPLFFIRILNALRMRAI
jgi:hypothetical protein